MRKIISLMIILFLFIFPFSNFVALSKNDVTSQLILVEFFTDKTLIYVNDEFQIFCEVKNVGDKTIYCTSSFDVYFSPHDSVEIVQEKFGLAWIKIEPDESFTCWQPVIYRAVRPGVVEVRIEKDWSFNESGDPSYTVAFFDDLKIFAPAESILKLDVELVDPSPPDGDIRLQPITFRARVTSSGQPVRDAFVSFSAGNGGTGYIGQPNIRTDYQGYAEVKNWDPKWDHEVTFRWWAEAWKEGYESGSSEKRSLTYFPSANAGWPTFMQNPQHTGYTQEEGPDVLNVIWRTSVGELGECTSVVVANEKVYAIFKQTLFCFDARTGDQLWTGKKQLAADSIPFIKDGRIYAITWDNSIICFDAYNGEALWEVFIPAEYGKIYMMYNSLTIANGKVYVKSYEIQGSHASDYARVLCYDLNTRFLLWSTDIGRSNYQSIAPITIYDGKVYVVGGYESFWRSSYDDVIYCIDAYSGNILWMADLPIRSNWLDAPIAWNKRIYAKYFNPEQGYSLTCLNASKGNVIWDATFASPVHKLSVAYRCVYFSTNDAIYCLNAETGKIVWKNKDFSHVWTPFAVASGKIYLCDIDGIVVLDAITGNTICRFQDKFHEPCAPAITNGNIYVAVVSANGVEARSEVLCLGQLEGYPVNVIDAEKVLIREFTSPDGRKFNEYVLTSIYTKRASENKITVYVELNTVFEYWDKSCVNVEYVEFDRGSTGGFVKGYIALFADEEATILWEEATLWVKSKKVEDLFGWYYSDITYYGNPNILKETEEKVTVLPGGKEKIIIYEGGNIAPAFYLRWRGDIPYNEWKSNYRFDIAANKILPGLGEVVKSLTIGALPVVSEIIDMGEILEYFIEEQSTYMLLDDNVISDVPDLNHYDFVVRSWDASGREQFYAPICAFSSVVMEVPIKIDPAKTHNILVRGKVLPYDCPYNTVLFAKNFEVNLFKELADPPSAGTPFEVLDFTNGQWSILDEKEQEIDGKRVKFSVCVFSPDEDQQTKYIFIETSSLTKDFPLRGGLASIVVDEMAYVKTNIMAIKYFAHNWEGPPHGPPFVIDYYPTHYYDVPEGNRKIVKAYTNIYLFILSRLPKIGKIFGAIKTMFDVAEYFHEMESKEIIEGFTNDAELDEHSYEWGSGGIYDVESMYYDIITVFPVKFYSIEDKFIVRSNVEIAGKVFVYSDIFGLKQQEKRVTQYIFNTLWDGLSYPVIILSDSSVEDFIFNQPSKQISFKISGDKGTSGYCDVAIPKSLLIGEPWTVKLNGTIHPFTSSENKTYSFIHLTCTFTSTYEVTIQGTWSIPEFPLAALLLSFTLITFTLTILLKKKAKL